MDGTVTITHLNSLGIDQIKIGDTLPKNENIRELSMYPEHDKVVFNPTNYKYFYIPDHFYKLNNFDCDINNLFFAIDSNNYLVFIFRIVTGNIFLKAGSSPSISCRFCLLFLNRLQALDQEY